MAARRSFSRLVIVAAALCAMTTVGIVSPGKRVQAVLELPQLLRWQERPDGIDFGHLRASMAQVRTASRPFGGIPLVLTHGKEEPPAPGEAPELAARMSQVWGEMQADLAPRSSNSVQVVARKSGHFIQFDAPKLVVGTVLEVVRAARTHSALDAVPLRQLAAEGSSAP
jgi:pimeloyl-ACP methyl ester carboxylesterase